MNVNLNKQLTKNFKLGEFLTSKFYNRHQQRKVLQSVDYRILENIHELADNLQVLRDVIGKPISINIGFRPKWWELEKGRSGNSKHTKGQAVDIVVSGMTPFKVSWAIEELIDEGKIKQGGLKAYNTFVHYDIRGYNARW